MNRLKREMILTTYSLFGSGVAVFIGFFTDIIILTVFGTTIFMISLLYSFYLNKEIKKQKEENQKRKSN